MIGPRRVPVKEVEDVAGWTQHWSFPIIATHPQALARPSSQRTTTSARPSNNAPVLHTCKTLPIENIRNVLYAFLCRHATNCTLAPAWASELRMFKGRPRATERSLVAVVMPLKTLHDRLDRVLDEMLGAL